MAGVLTEVSDGMAAAVAAAGKSVVRVEGRRRIPASGIVWSADGLIVTADHAVESEEQVAVGLADGGRAEATIVGRDPSTDLAVLRASATGLTPVAWAGAEGLRVGHLVLALGRPGATVRASLGIVSALGEGWRTPSGGRIDRYLQTDVVMYPGFSGGPLIDVAARAVGINSSGLARGASVAIPASTVQRVLETILRHGRVRRGFLGIGAQAVRLPQPLAARTGQETGLLIASLESGGPADKSGLMLGDILVSLDGEPTRRLEELLGFLGERVGTQAKAAIVRGGEVRQVQVQIGER